jgi:hypothetical protein
VELGRTLSHKVNPDAFLFKATKVSETTKKTSKYKKDKYLIDYLLPLAHTLWPYLYNPTLIFLQLFKPTPIFLQLDFFITNALSC